jgi:FlaG/FlaF family flagellin (archaellin)
MRFKKRNEDAVSPVVGVMLMLVVTIIIAAVVSGFAGGIMGSNNQKTPMLSMDAEITNTGFFSGSGFKATITSVSEPIATDNLRITTSWSTTNKTEESYGQPISGGGNVIGQEINNGGTIILLPPYGFGAGVEKSTLFEPYNDEQAFGAYTFQQGTGLIASPSGSGYGVDGTDYGYGVESGIDVPRYNYTEDADHNTGKTGYQPGIATSKTGKLDPVQAMLGEGWENLRAGDVVQVNVIYVPTGKVILSKDVTVGE